MLMRLAYGAVSVPVDSTISYTRAVCLTVAPRRKGSLFIRRQKFTIRWGRRRSRSDDNVCAWGKS